MKLALTTVAILAGVAAACRPPVAAAPKLGTVSGLARDAASGEAISAAAVVLRAEGDLQGVRVVTDAEGGFSMTKLDPGRYRLSASFAGELVEVTAIEVVANRTASVDVWFELGRAESRQFGYLDLERAAIARYRPRDADRSRGILEGTVNDLSTRERVVGAGLIVTSETDGERSEAFTDDRGRFRLGGLAPGNYSVTTYYTMLRRAAVEVRRTGIEVRGGEAVVVPLWVELEQ